MHQSCEVARSGSKPSAPARTYPKLCRAMLAMCAGDPDCRAGRPGGERWSGQHGAESGGGAGGASHPDRPALHGQSEWPLCRGAPRRARRDRASHRAQPGPGAPGHLLRAEGQARRRMGRRDGHRRDARHDGRPGERGQRPDGAGRLGRSSLPPLARPPGRGPQLRLRQLQRAGRVGPGSGGGLRAPHDLLRRHAERGLQLPRRERRPGGPARRPGPPLGPRDGPLLEPAGDGAGSHPPAALERRRPRPRPVRRAVLIPSHRSKRRRHQRRRRAADRGGHAPQPHVPRPGPARLRRRGGPVRSGATAVTSIRATTSSPAAARRWWLRAPARCSSPATTPPPATTS